MNEKLREVKKGDKKRKKWRKRDRKREREKRAGKSGRGRKKDLNDKLFPCIGKFVTVFQSLSLNLIWRKNNKRTFCTKHFTFLGHFS